MGTRRDATKLCSEFDFSGSLSMDEKDNRKAYLPEKAGEAVRKRPI
jgi:hypothetical protein